MGIFPRARFWSHISNKFCQWSNRYNVAHRFNSILPSTHIPYAKISSISQLHVPEPASTTKEIPLTLRFLWSECFQPRGHLCYMDSFANILVKQASLGMPGWLSSWASAFNSGCDLGVPGSSPISASLHGACFSFCLCLCPSLYVSHE